MAAPWETGAPGDAGATPPWDLVLYISGASPHSMAAVSTVRRLCDTELPSGTRFTVIDVLSEPTRAAQDEILAVPALVLRSPEPGRRFVGDLTDLDRDRLWVGLVDASTDSAGRQSDRA